MSEKPVRLVTKADEFERHSRAVLLRAARRRPQSVVVVTVKDGNIQCQSSSMSRLELMGALHAAMTHTWSGDD